MPSLLRIPWISQGWSPASSSHQVAKLLEFHPFKLLFAGVQPRLIQGIRSGDGVGDLFIYKYLSKI